MEKKGEEAKRSFWQKNKFILVVVLTLFSIYAIFIFNQKINFLLGNEMIVHLSPQQKFLTMHYGQSSEIEFNISIQNAAYCQAFCSYSFFDASRNNIEDKNNFTIGLGQRISKKYNVTVKRAGSGQDIYNFDARCRSIPSIICRTDSPEKFRSSFVIVNYELTELEKQLKQSLKKNLTNFLVSFRNADIEHQFLDKKHYELSFDINLLNLSQSKHDLDGLFDKMRVSVESLRSLWSSEAYVNLNRLFNESFYDDLGNIRQEINELEKSIESIAKVHNGILFDLKNLQASIKASSHAINLIGDERFLSDLSQNAAVFEVISSSVTNNTFSNYTDLAGELNALKKSQNTLIQKTRIPAAKIFAGTEYYISYEGDILCSLRQDCAGDYSLNKTINSTQAFLYTYPAISQLESNCDSLRRIVSYNQRVVNETIILMEQRTIRFPSDDNFTRQAEIFMDNIKRDINNSYILSIQQSKAQGKFPNLTIDIVASYAPASTSSIKPFESRHNMSIYWLSKLPIMEETTKFIDRCRPISPYPLKDFNFTPIITEFEFNISSDIEVGISDNPPVCCVFNECKPCCSDEKCRSNPENFPLILVHGHSFVESNSPEFSLDAFNKIQRKLQEDGYLNAGIVSMYSKNENFTPGVWGLSGKPVTVKASYYYDAFSEEGRYIVVPTKSENIDTYALRIREVIDLVRERTGSPKVNIISHSMGGLVARRYMQIFGDGNVHKHIMIGTPNHGITEKVADYCSIVGENRECRDMRDDSIFIKKLNGPFEQPTEVSQFVIIGKGCKLENDDSDGIVILESAELENAESFFVDGACGGFKDSLHTKMLDVDRYPRTYEAITNILMKNN